MVCNTDFSSRRYDLRSGVFREESVQHKNREWKVEDLIRNAFRSLAVRLVFDLKIIYLCMLSNETHLSSVYIL